MLVDMGRGGAGGGGGNIVGGLHRVAHVVRQEHDVAILRIRPLRRDSGGIRVHAVSDFNGLLSLLPQTALAVPGLAILFADGLLAIRFAIRPRAILLTVGLLVVLLGNLFYLPPFVLPTLALDFRSLPGKRGGPHLFGRWRRCGRPRLAAQGGTRKLDDHVRQDETERNQDVHQEQRAASSHCGSTMLNLR